MNSAARLVLVTVCAVLFLCVLAMIVAAGFGKPVSDPVVKTAETALAFLGGVLAQTREHSPAEPTPATEPTP